MEAAISLSLSLSLGRSVPHFNLDFAPPFTPFSAFALAVSQF